ncbi:MAG TPA: STAS/SEC14 domain-containing protein [Gallionellaceae bacterium]|nr:STAS/SEC14 domain-containing protein [Gallionellaceae bacterium]
MISQIETGSPRILGLKLSGKLKDEDYHSFAPAVDQMIAAVPGKVRLFVRLEDFYGWDLHGAWDDLAFGIKHYSDTDRIAMVGEKKWEEWMTLLWKPFSRAEVRYFDAAHIGDAWTWIREGL